MIRQLPSSHRLLSSATADRNRQRDLAVNVFSGLARRKQLKEGAGEACAAEGFPPQHHWACQMFEQCLAHVKALTGAQSDHEPVASLLIAESRAREQFLRM
jgi:hypothetical protein